MEGLSHDIIQWGGMAAAAFAIWRIWVLVRTSVADRVNTERDIEHLRIEVKRLKKRDGRIFDKLDEVIEEQRKVSVCLARIEERYGKE